MENTLELHYPGSNYTGPGTHVINRVLDRVFPTDYDDAVTLVHDIEYLMYSDNKELIRKADTHAIEQATLDFHGLATRLGLTLGKLLDLNFYSSDIPTNVGYALRDFVLNDPEWRDVINKYEVSFTPVDRK